MSFKSVPLGVLLRTIEDLAYLSRKERIKLRILWSGGEPTNYPHIFQLTKKASDLGIKVGMITNGTTLTKHVIRKIIESEIKLIIVSVDGATDQVHDFHRGVSGSFRRTMAGVKRLVCMKNDSIKVGFNTVITSKNCWQIGSIIDLAVQTGVDLFSLSPVRGDIYGKLKNFTLKNEDLIAVNEILSKKRTEYKGVIYFQTPINLLTQFSCLINGNDGLAVECYSGINHIHINPLGKVYPCYEFDWLDIPLSIMCDNITNHISEGSLASFYRTWITKIKETMGYFPCRCCTVFYNLLSNGWEFKDML
jgi:MoaA/NifB/PqqE/SkfB family radical SAM enzyme